jgi:F-type H+-transporting ATPase subunit delta
MKFSARNYAEALYEVLAVTPDAEVVIERFVQVLARNRHLGRLKAVVAEFEKVYNRHNHTVRADITVARPIDETEKNHIASALKKATGQSVEIHTAVDPGIIGGVIIRLDDTLIDGSLKNQLTHLYTQLTS